MNKITMIVGIIFAMIYSITQASFFDRVGLALTGATCCLFLPATTAATTLYCGTQCLIAAPLAIVPQGVLCMSGGQLCYMAYSNHKDEEESE